MKANLQVHSKKISHLPVDCFHIWLCVSRGGSCTLITSTCKYDPLVYLLNALSLKMKRRIKRQMCSRGKMGTACFPHLKTNSYNSHKVDYVIDELCYTQDLCAQDTLTCSKPLIGWSLNEFHFSLQDILF